MPNDVVAAMLESQRHFHELIEAPLGKVLGIDRFELIEGIDSNIARELDQTAGIDAWGYHHAGLIGLALRIQYDMFYETFTIRCRRESGAKTEYEKRLEAFHWGALAPTLTVQAYVDRKANKLYGGAVARTEDLLTCIKQGKYRLLATGDDQIGRASFYVIKWSDVADLETADSKPWCPTFGLVPHSQGHVGGEKSQTRTKDEHCCKSE